MFTLAYSSLTSVSQLLKVSRLKLSVAVPPLPRTSAWSYAKLSSMLNFTFTKPKTIIYECNGCNGTAQVQ